MSAAKESFFQDCQRLLDNDSYYQRMLLENDSSWWMSQDRAFSGEPTLLHEVISENGKFNQLDSKKQRKIEW